MQATAVTTDPTVVAHDAVTSIDTDSGIGIPGANSKNFARYLPAGSGGKPKGVQLGTRGSVDVSFVQKLNEADKLNAYRVSPTGSTSSAEGRHSSVNDALPGMASLSSTTAHFGPQPLPEIRTG